MLTVDFITNKVLHSRTYILCKENSNCVWLVDCGDTDRVLEKVGDKIVEGVLLTHTHSDHIYGLEELIKRYPSVKVYTNSEGVGALKSPKLNLSHYHSEYPDISIDSHENVRVVEEGDILEILGVLVHVYETPGHDPSCITYEVEDNLFTGDAYIPGQKIFTGFPHANKKQAKESLERILQLERNHHILAGHTIISED